MNERDSKNRFNRKPGITYLKCQHLIEDKKGWEHFNLWIGENRRLILCTICTDVMFGTFMKVFHSIERFEIQDNTELAPRDPRDYETFVQRFIRWCRGLVKSAD